MAGDIRTLPASAFAPIPGHGTSGVVTVTGDLRTLHYGLFGPSPGFGATAVTAPSRRSALAQVI